MTRYNPARGKQDRSRLSTNAGTRTSLIRGAASGGSTNLLMTLWIGKGFDDRAYRLCWLRFNIDGDISHHGASMCHARLAGMEDAGFSRSFNWNGILCAS